MASMGAFEVHRKLGEISITWKENYTGTRHPWQWSRFTEDANEYFTLCTKEDRK
jgi:hypothetical protein